MLITLISDLENNTLTKISDMNFLITNIRSG